jgi:hypothetical protein
MEDVYNKKLVETLSKLSVAYKEILKLQKENTELKEQIIFMRTSLSSVVNDIIELTTTDEDDCPCGGNCNCSGDDCLDTTK